ncbi:hypothetical protein E4T42_01881 [Aureobasidium subglaciale]|nr:hypothetical protein E4T42_01881 [Aureobasidium subglaciale]
MSDISSPAVAPQQQKKSFYQRSRQATLDSIASDTNYDWLFQNIRFFLEYPQQVYLQHGSIRTDDELEQQLKLLWFKTIEAAKVFAADDEARQYKLVAWIAAARARENVQSTTQDPFEADGGKVMWRDLPFFKVALEEAWGGRASLSKDAWTNLNAFVSRLAAVTGMDLMRFGLETIREALEEERPIYPTGDGGDIGQKSVADLLPAALLWLKHTHSFMSTRLPPIERAVKDGVEPPSGCGESVAPGDLATADGVSRNDMAACAKKPRKVKERQRKEMKAREEEGKSDEGQSGEDASVSSARKSRTVKDRQQEDMQARAEEQTASATDSAGEDSE